MQKVVTKKTSKGFLKKTKDIKLSIQFSLGGFSFCIQDSNSKEALLFTNYKFDKLLSTPEDLLQKIEAIFKEDTNLQLEYDEIEVIHTNNLSTLVPNKYFNEKLLSKYLDFNIKTLQTDFITFDHISLIEAKNVYIPYVNINNYIFQNFGEFEYKHHKTILTEKLIELNTNSEKVMFVNVIDDHFDIVVLKEKSLLFSNTFQFKSKEDFIYYILFTAEQLELDPEEFKLYFTGEINQDDDIFKICYQYIRNTLFLENNNPKIKNLSITNHSNFILLG